MVRAIVVAMLVLGLVACSGSAHPLGDRSAPASAPASPLARWRIALRVSQPVDIAGPRADGRLIVAADGRLALFSPPRGLKPFARGSRGPGGRVRGGYSTRRGLEPYVTLTPSLPAAVGGCSFHAGDVYALAPYEPLGVIRIDAAGRATRFARLPGGGLPDGITYDQVGRFGHRLLVTEEFGPRHASLYAIDCHGHRHMVTGNLPRLEGGIAVAPSGFGAYGGDLVAPDEYSGNVLAVTPPGRARVLAASGLPAGGDTGVESAGFVPAGRPSAAAYVSDRLTPHHHYAGDDALLELTAADLRRAGVRAGDLLVATEGGGLTDDIRCAASCTVRQVAVGTPRAYIEGHIEFGP